ncbi:UDP-glucose 4-epimerase [Bacteriovorax sp. BSW11_IV]|uniref:polysaccharide biosynthesis protein n=1 Tax=Bacteriovorax sp. BSW11_IV TaxID=1353529 RepID=UPI00038A1BCD|nr:polysaccharide biosynthesis protein [Bacteriovorax sp. BSW11_IV]EQC45823.1 UDP-glucose 4-epimerase [Bacteriovorax sp. BSW11_IV]
MKELENKTILITGGTGSFGSTVLKKLLSYNVKEIRIFSRDEKKQDDMRNTFRDPKLKFIIGDVRNYKSVYDASKGVDYIYHAAALKQVPSCEFYPLEAIKTNALGTDNVLSAAIENKVLKVVCLSTDKAVYPVNAMGMTKALMEKILVSKSRITSETSFIGTRYGNVMASRGSVIPLFIKQIKNNEPITITDPKMTRFMMSLDEAVDLVLYAFSDGENGDIYVQKAPAATIETLALALKEIFKSEVPIKVIGTRHGEKAYESLLSREEFVKAVDKGNYYKVPDDNRDLNYQNYFSEGEIEVSNVEDYNSNNTNILNVAQMKEVLLNLDYVKEELNNA